MDINLNVLKENELRKFSYQDTKCVIEKLEKICISDGAGIDAIEKSEMYYAFSALIYNRVSNDEFIELNNNNLGEKESLCSKLIFMLASFKYSLEVSKLQKDIKSISKNTSTLEANMTTMTNQLQDTIADYNNKKTEIDLQLKDSSKLVRTLGEEIQNFEIDVEDFQSRMDESEHTILTHVLTLMGIFSAVITIIMSIVVTSSSWLNNADASSAIVAFVIPNLVALLAVSSLVLLVFIYVQFSNKTPKVVKKKTIKKIKKDSSEIQDSTIETTRSERKERKGSRAAIVFFSILLLIICVTSLAMADVSIAYTRKNSIPHMRYVIPKSNYQIVEETSSETSEIELYFEFIFEDINYQITYDEKLVHFGNLYFCKEHNTLE